MSLQQEILADAPIGYWREIDGVDHSGNALHLTPFGSSSAGASLDVSDAADPSMVFDPGENLWNPAHDAAFDLAQLSLSFLMKPATVGDADRDTVRKGALYGVFIGTDSKLHAQIRTPGVTHTLDGATTIVEDTVYSVGLSYDGATLRLYLNGAEESSVTLNLALDPNNSVSFTIGTAASAGNGFDGTLDEVALYDHALSAERFSEHHESSLGLTLYVNPGAPGADDTGDYTDAQNPATPLATIDRALELAQPHDTIRVSYAAAANLGDPNGQTDVYARSNDDTFGGVTIPHKDASTGRIKVQGVSVLSQRPRWLGLNTRFPNNWRFDNIEYGYPIGSGFEYDTACALLGITDCWWMNCFFTGGIADLHGWHGRNRWIDCKLTSKLRNIPNPDYMEGAGLRCLATSDETNFAGPDDWVEWLRMDADDVQGEDALQLLGSVDRGCVLVEDSQFNNMSQTGLAHTDAIQTTGCAKLIVRRTKMGEHGIVASMIIASDGQTGYLELVNNWFKGRPGQSGFSTQFSGVLTALVEHNTWENSGFAGLRWLDKGDATPGSRDYTIRNNIIDHHQVDVPMSGAGITWTQDHNLIGLGPATDDDIVGFAEYGVSADTAAELSNDPVNSPGIDQAAVTDVLTDRLGRPRKGAAPDCGCHESDPDVPVIAGPRPPYVVAFTPSGASVDRDTVVVLTLFPKPGQEIDPDTVTTGHLTIADSDGHQATGTTVSLGELDENGHQAITLDPTPTPGVLLDKRVDFTATASTAIADTQGSALAAAVSTSFRSAGRVGFAAGTDDGAPDPGVEGWAVGMIS